jgi:shikimate kinase
MTSSAVSNSAISILNAIGIGFGGAIGIDIQCKVRATLSPKKKDDREFLVVRTLTKDEHGLIPKCVSYVEYFLKVKLPNDNKLVVEVDSDIPVAVGLKSSSAISTAVVSSVSELLSGKEISARDVLRLSCKASVDCGVSITGAYDDAISSLLGGMVLTNNRRFRVLKHADIPSNLGSIAVVRVPRRMKVYTSSVRTEMYSQFKKNSKDAFQLAKQGNIMGAMMLNSLVQCSTLGYTFEPIISAILGGATCAGVSGKGPAIACLCTTSKISRQIERRWIEDSKNPDEIQVIRTNVVQPKELMNS